MTLNETWKRCLAMWRWIVARRKEGDERDVWNLKDAYLAEFDPDADPLNKCYFCQYNVVFPVSSYCANCPGVLVDPAFNCMSNEYHFQLHPEAFLSELERLNALRGEDE